MKNILQMIVLLQKLWIVFFPNIINTLEIMARQSAF